MASVVLEPERLSPGSNHLYCPSYKVHLPAEGVKSSISFPFTLIFAMVSSYPNAASLFSFAGMMVTDRFGVTADETERARSVEHTYIMTAIIFIGKPIFPCNLRRPSKIIAATDMTISIRKTKSVLIAINPFRAICDPPDNPAGHIQ